MFLSQVRNVCNNLGIFHTLTPKVFLISEVSFPSQICMQQSRDLSYSHTFIKYSLPGKFLSQVRNVCDNLGIFHILTPHLKYSLSVMFLSKVRNVCDNLGIFHTLTPKVFLISEVSFPSQKCMQQSRDLSYPHTFIKYSLSVKFLSQVRNVCNNLGIFHTLTPKVFLISEVSFPSQKCMQQSRDLSYPHTFIKYSLSVKFLSQVRNVCDNLGIFHTLTPKVFLISEVSFPSQKCMQQSRDLSYPHTFIKYSLSVKFLSQVQSCMQQSRDLSYPNT